MKKKTLAVLIADFNLEITSVMKETALEEIASQGAKLAGVFHVPGCYELPLIATQLITSVDGLVVLGFIERGETLHGEVMGHVVHDALVRLSLEQNTPIGLGIIGPGATVEQAHARKEGHARAAVRAALAAMSTIDEL